MLDAIENGFQVDDPVFAAKLNFTATRRHFRRQTVLAHGCLWLGMFMTLTGFGLVHDVLGLVRAAAYGAAGGRVVPRCYESADRSRDETGTDHRAG